MADASPEASSSAWRSASSSSSAPPPKLTISASEKAMGLLANAWESPSSGLKKLCAVMGVPVLSPWPSSGSRPVRGGNTLNASLEASTRGCFFSLEANPASSILQIRQRPSISPLASSQSISRWRHASSCTTSCSSRISAAPLEACSVPGGQLSCLEAAPSSRRSYRFLCARAGTREITRAGRWTPLLRSSRPRAVDNSDCEGSDTPSCEPHDADLLRRWRWRRAHHSTTKRANVQSDPSSTPAISTATDDASMTPMLARGWTKTRHLGKTLGRQCLL